MPILENLQSPLDRDITSMEDVLYFAQDLLGNIVGCWRGLLFDERHRQALEHAWRDIYTDSLVAELEAVSSELDAVGLGGSQLALKLGGLVASISVFRQFPSVRKLLSVLDWLISLLASLARKNEKVEQLKELIEAVQKLMNKD